MNKATVAFVLAGTVLLSMPALADDPKSDAISIAPMDGVQIQVNSKELRLSGDYTWLDAGTGARIDAHASVPLTAATRENGYVNGTLGKGFAGSFTFAYDSRAQVHREVWAWVNRYAVNVRNAYCVANGIIPGDCESDFLAEKCRVDFQKDLDTCLDDFVKSWCKDHKDECVAAPQDVQNEIAAMRQGFFPFSHEFFWTAGADVSGEVDRLPVLFGNDLSKATEPVTSWSAEVGAHASVAWQPILYDLRIGWKGARKVEGDSVDRCVETTGSDGTTTGKDCSKVIQVKGAARASDLKMKQSAYVRNGILIAFMGHRPVGKPPKFIPGLEVRLDFEDLTDDAKATWYGKLKATLFLARAFNWGGPRVGIGIDWAFGNQSDFRPFAVVATTF